MTALTLVNPRRPEPIGTLEILGVWGVSFYTYTHIGAAEDHVFLMSDDGTLRVIDYADPADPALVASSRVLPIVEDVAVEDDIAYVAASWAAWSCQAPTAGQPPVAAPPLIRTASTSPSPSAPPPAARSAPGS